MLSDNPVFCKVNQTEYWYIKLIPKVAVHYENNMKRDTDVQICKCADVQMSV